MTPTKTDPAFSKSGMAKARITDSIRRRLNAAHARFKTNDTEILAALIEAFLDEVERVDAVRWPVTVRMAERRQLMQVAEEAPGYGKVIESVDRILSSEDKRRSRTQRPQKTKPPTAP